MRGKGRWQPALPSGGAGPTAAARRSCPGSTETELRHDGSGAEDSGAGAGRDGERRRAGEGTLRGRKPPPCGVRGWEWDWDVGMWMETGWDVGKWDMYGTGCGCGMDVGLIWSSGELRERYRG